MSFDQYAFVLNLYRYEGCLPIAITDTLELNRSTAVQSHRIQELLQYYGRTSRTGQWLYTVEPVDEPPLKRLLITAIDEPQFIFDLKAC